MVDGVDIDKLNVLISRQHNLELLAPIGKSNDSSEDIWLIHVPFAAAANLSNIFRKSPLRLDSHVFAFFSTHTGNSERK